MTEEQRAPQMTQGHLLEYRRQRKKHQTRAGIRVDAVSEASWEDDKARHNGNQGIKQGDVYRFARELPIACYVAAKNRHGANAD